MLIEQSRRPTLSPPSQMPLAPTLGRGPRAARVRGDKGPRRSLAGSGQDPPRRNGANAGPTVPRPSSRDRQNDSGRMSVTETREELIWQKGGLDGIW